MAINRQREVDKTYISSKMADPFLLYDRNIASIVPLPIRDCLQVTFGNEQNLARWLVRIFPAVKHRRVCAALWTSYHARREVHRWAVALKLLNGPDLAFK